MEPTLAPGIIGTTFPDLQSELVTLLSPRLNRLAKAIEDQGLTLPQETRFQSELTRTLLFSEFAGDHLIRDPKILHRLAHSGDLHTPYSDKEYSRRLDEGLKDVDASGVKALLLAFKQYEIIRIAWRDLNGRADLEESLRDLSNLAMACIQKGVETLHTQLVKRYGIPTDEQGWPMELIVLGMGKLGAWELNFSSDIDLIFVYPEDGYTRLNGQMETSNADFFTRLCKGFLALFTTDTGSNFYRVDTRLRPFGDSGPLAMSAAAFEDYYQAHGREWERYAMIKAQPVAGDIQGGYKLLKALNPFIYRRYFDYGSFDSFRDMKERINLQVKSTRLKNNIKMGIGGIREVEFFGQLFQLIRGGVEPDLQEHGILKVLELLVHHKIIPQGVKKDLTQAYVFLRRTENRLQEYRDLQTHDIPENPLQRKILALSMDFDSFNEFKKELDSHLERVHHHFSQLLVTEKEGEEGQTSPKALKEIWIHINDPQVDPESLNIDGYANPQRVIAILQDLAAHPNTRRLTPNGQKKLGRLIPKVLKKTLGKEDAEAILAKLIDLIVTIERRTCYLSLLIENKGVLDTLITLIQKSPWIIHFMAQHPVLLDELIHPVSLYAPPGKAILASAMASRMARVDPDDGEYILEELNIFRQINTLRVAAADVSGNYPLMKVSDHLTYIAEAILTEVLTFSWNTVVKKYGLPPHLIGDKAPAPTIENCGFAIIAYGKVGGWEMGYKSDLDLVFLHRGEPGTTRGGKRDIDTVRFYSNLSQRIIHALTLHTAAGTLYGADMRLRPGGNAGMIVSHIEGYEEYLKEDAWTWEHQALIRARPITGDKALFSRFDAIRHGVLCARRRDQDLPEQDPPAPPGLKTEVANMRERLRREKLKTSPEMFDLKQGKGGIVDIEFLVQYLTLRHAHKYPDVAVWTDNIRLLEGLSCEGLITGEESELLQRAYVAMRRVIHRLTLQEQEALVEEDRFQDMAGAVDEIYQKKLGSPRT